MSGLRNSRIWQDANRVDIYGRLAVLNLRGKNIGLIYNTG
jgi:hypothetical protein